MIYQILKNLNYFIHSLSLFIFIESVITVGTVVVDQMVINSICHSRLDLPGNSLQLYHNSLPLSNLQCSDIFCRLQNLINCLNLFHEYKNIQLFKIIKLTSRKHSKEHLTMTIAFPIQSARFIIRYTMFIVLTKIITFADKF